MSHPSGAARTGAADHVDLTVHVRGIDGGVLAELVGEVDLYSLTRAREGLREALAAGGGDLVVDLGAVTSIDSAGLGLLVCVHREVRARGGVVHLVATGLVARPFRLMRLDDVLTLHRSLSEAIAAAAAPGR